MYSIKNIKWIVSESNTAVCTYIFYWQGVVDGKKLRNRAGEPMCL